MKDIDFDELDRAVSSVLDPKADKKEPATDAAPVETNPEKPAEEPVTSEVSIESPEVPEVVQVTTAEPSATIAVASTAAVEEAAAAPTPPPAAKTSLAVKRRGQFMDMIHPSSDMKKPTDTPVSIERRKTEIKPISAVAAPEEAPALDEEVAPTVETTETIPATMPDPLDVMNEQASPSVPEAESAEAAEPTILPEGEEEVAPITPFLSDTEVEKRPLGAFSPEETPAETENEEAEPIADPLPPELGADVVAVEAGTVNETAGAESVQEPNEKATEEVTSSGLNESIPQQYTAAETATDEDHSIFDTKEYHQPLAPTKTKKGGLPGWLVAIIVILLLAGLGAAGGYFWFYYGL